MKKFSIVISLLLLIPTVYSTGGGGGVDYEASFNNCLEDLSDCSEMHAQCQIDKQELGASKQREGKESKNITIAIIVTISLAFYLYNKKRDTKNKEYYIPKSSEWFSKQDLHPEDKTTITLKRDVLERETEEFLKLKKELEQLKAERDDKYVKEINR